MWTFILFLIVWAIVEFILMTMSYYDDYGENWPWSLGVSLVAFIITGSIVFSKQDVDDNIKLLETDQVQQEQANMITEQQIDQIFDSVGKIISVDPSSPTDMNIMIGNSVEHTQVIIPELVVPSTVAHLDQSRRNHDTTVQYITDTKRACIGNNCFRAKLFQHTDGTFWACKRNYGVCYHYEMMPD